MPQKARGARVEIEMAMSIRVVRDEVENITVTSPHPLIFDRNLSYCRCVDRDHHNWLVPRTPTFGAAEARHDVSSSDQTSTPD